MFLAPSFLVTIKQNFLTPTVLSKLFEVDSFGCEKKHYKEKLSSIGLYSL